MPASSKTYPVYDQETGLFLWRTSHPERYRKPTTPMKPTTPTKKWNHITIDLTPLEAQMLRVVFSMGMHGTTYNRRALNKLLKKIRATLNPG